MATMHHEGDHQVSQQSGDEDDATTSESAANTSVMAIVNENHWMVNTQTVFHNVFYLAARPIKEPKNEQLILDMIRQANQTGGEEQQPDPDKLIMLAVPRSSDGWVLASHPDQPEEARLKLPVCRIIFFARGNESSSEASCFAFSSALVADEKSLDAKVSFQCHIFKCQMEEAVSKVFTSFSQAFQKPALLPDPDACQPDGPTGNVETFVFEVNLEIREKTSGSSSLHNAAVSHNPISFEVVPRQKGLFKLRSNVEKKVIISLNQLSPSSPDHRLGVERCFGMLVSPARNVRHADMQLLEKLTMSTECSSDNGGVMHIISGIWDPKESAFAVLNRETPSDASSVYLTIAADLVMTKVTEPVRFVIETRARILPQNERYWYYTKKSLVKHYSVRLQSKLEDGVKCYSILGIDISEEVDQRSKMSLSLHLANLTASTFGVLKSPPSVAEEDVSVPMQNSDNEDSDNEEPLLSGFGLVSKDCSGSVLDSWSQVLSEWDRENPLLFPKQLAMLVKQGVPEALRGEVWQRLTGASIVQDEIIETYRILITKESPDEKVILRDIHRTFPAHEFFKEAGGVGQESLYRISKAYSVYDAEIGYCQGQSFLIAALLLQMPEEQAFGVLVKIMHYLGLRDIFRENFDQLQLRLFQLDRLIQTQIPDLWQHFITCGVESHMYASQWFLTIFTAKFPLFLVFRVLDVFLLQGFDTIFQVALGILRVAKKDLLLQDFEGLMKYFRVNIPKMYRNEDNARHLMSVACSVKLKKLSKYEKEWLGIKEAERARENPVVRLERENKKLLQDNIRLEMENDNLARELVTSKIEMRRDMDSIEDSRDHFEKELEGTKMLLNEAAEERGRLEVETDQLKMLLKREVNKFDAELCSKNAVITEYKLICSQLSEKLDSLQTSVKANQPTSEPVVAETETDSDGSKQTSHYEERIKELELELAQTKLALVETECKNQDLIHQLGAMVQELQQRDQGKSTWFSKTLSSIRESTTASGSGLVRSTSASTSISSPPATASQAKCHAASKASPVDLVKKSSMTE